MASPIDDIATHISIECVDNFHGSPGVVVYGDKIFLISRQQDATQGTDSGDGRAPHSSVRVFKCPCYEVEDTNMERGGETAGDAHASIQEEVDEDE